jgi:protein TonB
MSYAIEQNNTHANVTRFFLATVLAIGVTFSLFAFMQYLIKGQNAPLVATTDVIEFEVMSPREEKATPNIDRRPPPPPKMQEPPRREMMPPTSTATNLPQLTPVIDVAVEPPRGNGGTLIVDTQARPIVRIPAKYPPTAAQQGLEGWVQISFSIDETGQVIDAKVTDAEPNRVFNREALAAVRKWKYQPKIVDGKGQIVTNQTVQIDFSLQDQQ